MDGYKQCDCGNDIFEVQLDNDVVILECSICDNRYIACGEEVSDLSNIDAY